MRSHSSRSTTRQRIFALIAATTIATMTIGVPAVAASENEEDACQIAGEIVELCVVDEGDGSVIALGDPVGPATSTFTYSENMTPLGYSARQLPLTGTGSNLYNSDLAFTGNYVIQGHYDGFRIIDVSDPTDPIQVSNVTGCGNTVGQGDIIVHGNLLIRSWDAAITGTCGGASVGTSFEGVNFFDISNKAAPVHLGNLRLATAARPNELTVDAPSAAAGSYTAAIAAYGPALSQTPLQGGGSKSGRGRARRGCRRGSGPRLG